MGIITRRRRGDGGGGGAVAVVVHRMVLRIKLVIHIKQPV